MENNTINLPGGGFVTLDSHNADDLSVVNSARVSFGKKVDKLSDGDEKLINFLMRERHGTPFEHTTPGAGRDGRRSQYDPGRADHLR